MIEFEEKSDFREVLKWFIFFQLIGLKGLCCREKEALNFSHDETENIFFLIQEKNRIGWIYQFI